MTTCPQTERPARTTVFILLTDLQQDPPSARPCPGHRQAGEATSEPPWAGRSGASPPPPRPPPTARASSPWSGDAEDSRPRRRGRCHARLRPAPESGGTTPAMLTRRPREDAGENAGPTLSGGVRVAGPREHAGEALCRQIVLENTAECECVCVCVCAHTHSYGREKRRGEKHLTDTGTCCARPALHTPVGSSRWPCQAGTVITSRSQMRKPRHREVT